MAKDKRAQLSILLEAQLFFALGGGVRWFREAFPGVLQSWHEAWQSRAIRDQSLGDLVHEALSALEIRKFKSPKDRLSALDQGVRRLIDAESLDRPSDQQQKLEQAVKSLIRQKIWLPGPKGRLLKQGDRWDLLWPLAGRDLSLSIPLTVDQLAEQVSGSPAPVFEAWIREDGRSFQGLRTSTRIQRILCGEA